jgi:hypothetical protein
MLLWLLSLPYVTFAIANRLLWLLSLSKLEKMPALVFVLLRGVNSAKVTKPLPHPSPPRVTIK